MRRTVREISPTLTSTLADLVAGRQPWPLYLWGPAGTGKTSAALALLDRCGPVLPADLRCSYPAGDWLAGYVAARTIQQVRLDADRGRLSWGRPGSGTDELRWTVIAEKLTTAPLLVVDDLGVGALREFGLQVLLDLLDPRLGDPVRPTVAVSNLPPSRLPEFTDERVADRLLAGTVVELGGASRRSQTLPPAPGEPPPPAG